MTICMPLMSQQYHWFCFRPLSADNKVCIYVFVPNSSKKYTIWKYRRTGHHKCSQPALYPIPPGKMKRKYEPASNAWQPKAICQRIEENNKRLHLDNRWFCRLPHWTTSSLLKHANFNSKRIQKQKDYDNRRKMDDKRETICPVNSHERRIWHPPFWNWKNVLNNFERNGPTGYQCPQRRNKEVETLIQRYLWKYLLSYRSSLAGLLLIVEVFLIPASV